MTEWQYAVRTIREHVVHIQIPDSYGTGFFIARRTQGKAHQVVVATAHHVVAHAAQWAELIRVTHLTSQKTVVLMPDALEVLLSPERDLALLVFDASLVDFPQKPVMLESFREPLPPGASIGWCGFPNMVPDHLCFFSGHVSATYREQGDYLVDGVAISGVSGGPVFIHRENKTKVVGLVSAYIPNLATGKSMPGMSLIRSVEPYLKHFRASVEGTQQETESS